MCCVALCQYIEATKFRDGARGNLASQGNPPTTHTLPISAWAPLQPFQPLTQHTLYFHSQQTFLLFFLTFKSTFFLFNWFLHRCGNPFFIFLSFFLSVFFFFFTHSDFAPSQFLCNPSSPVLRQTEGELMFHNHLFLCFALHTPTSLSPYTLNDFSPAWVCASLLLDSGIKIGSICAFLWLFFCVFFLNLCIATKAVRYIWLLHTDFSEDKEKSVLGYVTYSVAALLGRKKKKDKVDSFTWCDTTFLSGEMRWISLISPSSAWLCCFQRASDQTVPLLLHRHLETC